MPPIEKAAVPDLVTACRNVIGERYSPDAYNIGFKVGFTDGQTVPHCHCHLIPRYAGDETPAGRPEGSAGEEGVLKEIV